jgi:hypothetical protein
MTLTATRSALGQIVRTWQGHAWPKAGHSYVGMNGDGDYVVRLADGRPTDHGSRSAVATLRQADLTRFDHDPQEMVRFIFREVDYAYRATWPPPAPPFRIGTRSPKRLQPKRDANA